MGWISNRAVREKFEELSDKTLAEIAEIIVDLEADKQVLEEDLAEMTRERDELAAEIDANA